MKGDISMKKTIKNLSLVSLSGILCAGMLFLGVSFGKTFVENAGKTNSTGALTNQESCNELDESEQVPLHNRDESNNAGGAVYFDEQAVALAATQNSGSPDDEYNNWGEEQTIEDEDVPL